MRHRYDTRGIVLARSPLGESNALVTLITPGLGLIRARAQGVRKPGAKLAAALTTFAESSLVLVRGKEGWRIAGAVLEENWFSKMGERAARSTAARVSGLLLRVVARDVQDPNLFSVVTGFFEALTTLPQETYDAAEVLAALRVLQALGLDAGEIPGDAPEFSTPLLSQIQDARTDYIKRINHGLTASGL